ncbi:unnamed protein product [Camellia sinensis]
MKKKKKKKKRELSLEDEDESTRKKVKRIDPSEEKLQRLENQHIQRKRIGIINQSSSSSKSESADGAVSTSKKAIYGEKLELEFDLMKSMLRASYSESNDVEKLKENMELELALVVNNKAAYKVDLLEGDMKRFEKGLNGDGGGGEE